MRGCLRPGAAVVRDPARRAGSKDAGNILIDAPGKTAKKGWSPLAGTGTSRNPRHALCLSGPLRK